MQRRLQTGRQLVCRAVQNSMSPGLGVRKGRIPALAVGEFEVHPLLVVPGLVRGLQADGGGNNFEGAVAHDEPLVLRLYQLYKSAALWTIVAVELAAGAPHRGDAESRPRNFRANVETVQNLVDKSLCCSSGSNQCCYALT